MTYTYGANSKTKHIGVVSLETLDLSTGARIPELDHPEGIARDNGTISEGGQPGGPFEVQDGLTPVRRRSRRESFHHALYRLPYGPGLFPRQRPTS